MHLQHGTKRCPAPVLRSVATLIGLAWMAFAHADDTVSRPNWSLRGFGSAGVAYSNYADADYTASVLKGSGVGHSQRLTLGLDSRLGAQLALRDGQQWSAVLQVVSEQRINGSYSPVIEWANVKYQATPDLSLRIGRIALPIFLAADYRKVGYIYPWVRTPVEVYGAIPISSSDGVDATYRWSRDGVKNVTQAFFGRTTSELGTDSRIDARRLAGFSNTTEYGASSVRISMLTTELTVDILRDFFGALHQFGARGAALSDQYEVERKRASALSIGVNYDPGNWFATAEMGRMKSRSLLGDTTSLYASAGYRLGDFTPYLSVARVRSDGPTTEPGLDLAGLPPAAAATGAGLNSYLSWLLTTIPVQRTVSVGARWDCTTDVAFKVQFDRVTPLNGSRGTLINVQPGFRPGRSLNVASAVLDFVF
jgi:hypothetical protein